MRLEAGRLISRSLLGFDGVLRSSRGSRGVGDVAERIGEDSDRVDSFVLLGEFGWRRQWWEPDRHEDTGHSHGGPRAAWSAFRVG